MIGNERISLESLGQWNSALSFSPSSFSFLFFPLNRFSSVLVFVGVVMFIFFFCDLRVWTLGLAFARQVLFHLISSSSHLTGCLGVGLSFCLVEPGLQFDYSKFLTVNRMITRCPDCSIEREQSVCLTLNQSPPENSNTSRYCITGVNFWA